MKRHQLSRRIRVEVAGAPGAPRWFAGKTNRLALYSVRFCGLELNLYIQREWPEDTLSEDDLIGA